jgi:hypothetical protein
VKLRLRCATHSLPCTEVDEAEFFRQQWDRNYPDCAPHWIEKRERGEWVTL